MGKAIKAKLKAIPVPGAAARVLRESKIAM
jgi:hypothetical protein